jgi:CheY-like chemotaxis protein
LLDTPLNDEQREFVGVVFGEAQNLLGIVNDILDFSKIEAGKVQLETVRFDLGALAESVLDLVAPGIANRPVAVMSYIDPSLPATLVGDPGRIRQALINLAGNAVKFTDQGHVLLRVGVAPAAADAVTVRIEVEDTGIGIAEDVQARLFQPFSQADGSLARRYGGTGLGLAITRRLVQLMGGAIGVTSVLGQGSCFRLELPLARAEGEASPPSQPSLPDNRRIVVVSEDESRRAILAAYLEQWGAQVQSVPRLDAAHLGDNGARPDAIVVDAAGARSERWTPAESDPPRLWVNAPHVPGEVRAGDVYLPHPLKRQHLFEAVRSVGASATTSRHDAPAAVAARQSAPAATGKSPLAAPEANHDSPRLLLVEDNLTIRKVTLTQLLRLGFRAEAVNSGVAAVEAVAAAWAENRPYDLALMDVQMPEMDGLTATGEIRKLEAVTGGHLPIVALTAYAMKGDRERCLAAGMDDYLGKPVVLAELEAVLTRWLRPQSVAEPEVAIRIVG